MPRSDYGKLYVVYLPASEALCEGGVEVADAKIAQQELSHLSLPGKMLETATGFIYEITDSCENTIGFADYEKKPDISCLK